MKVLQLIDTLDAGGAERMAVNIANAALENNIISYLCATRRGGSLENDIDNSVDFFLLEKKGKLDINAFRRFFKWVKEEQIDIIHAHSTSLFLAVIAKLRYPKLKIVWHNHFGNSSSLKGMRLGVYKFLSRFVAINIALNEELLNWSSTHLKAGKDVILSNFVKLNPAEIPSTSLKGISGKRVLCLANLRVEKNHVFLMEAFKNVQDHFPEWTLHLVGKDSGDTYSKEIQDYIKQNKLERSIFIYGGRPDVSAILFNCDIGVLVSKFEAEPLSLIEYGFAGLPVIVTDVGKCATIVGDTGLVISQSGKELQKGLEKLFESRDYRASLGNRFRESVQKNYSQESTMIKLKSLYSSLIS